MAIIIADKLSELLNRQPIYYIYILIRNKLYPVIYFNDNFNNRSLNDIIIYIWQISTQTVSFEFFLRELQQKTKKAVEKILST